MAANKKSVTINVRIWAHVIRNDHITIKIASPDAGLISTVEGRSFGARSHKNLYKKLKTILVKEGKWPPQQPS